MQANRRFIQDIADPAEIRTQLAGQVNALCFAARKRGSAAVKRLIFESDFSQEIEPGTYFKQCIIGNGSAAVVEL